MTSTLPDCPACDFDVTEKRDSLVEIQKRDSLVEIQKRDSLRFCDFDV